MNDILKELKTPKTERKGVPADRVRMWMQSVDPDALGATYVFLSKAEHVGRVDPPLPFDSVFDFMLRYYEYCLRNDPQSKWANSAYSAGMDLVGWFVWMWDEDRDRSYLKRVKTHLENLYLSGSPELRKCVEHAVMEHLFERKAIRTFFDNWRTDPGLRPAYDEAMLWIKRGGRSPLTDVREM